MFGGAAFHRLTDGVSELTDIYRVYKVTRYLLGVQQQMAANRIADKLKHVSGVVQRAGQRIEKRADELLARENEIEKKSEAAFKPHHAHLDTLHEGLNELETALDQLSNSDPSSESGAR